jgi:hypothetical protein
MYRQLDPAQIIATARTLSNRIADRFPGSGLSRVSIELLDVARESHASIERTSRPYWPLRLLAFSGLVLLIAIVATALSSIPLRGSTGGWVELAQGVEAVVNEVVFLAIAVFFLFTLESRRRRRRALRAIHELRSIAHIVDMHQLTKDPDAVMAPERATQSSPERRRMTRFELSRYLDYCSELLSITSKLAALHAQHVQDPVVLDAVNGIQNLTHGLSGKIWQKILILDSPARVERDERALTADASSRDVRRP